MARTSCSSSVAVSSAFANTRVFCADSLIKAIVHQWVRFIQRIPAEDIYIVFVQQFVAEFLHFNSSLGITLHKEQVNALYAKLKAFENGGPAEHAYPPHELPEEEKKKRAAKAKPVTKPIQVPRDANSDPNSPDAPWRTFPVPFGRDSGTQLAKMDKKVLFGWWLNFEVKTTWTNGEGKVFQVKPDKLAKDKLFRQMLDEAGKHYEFDRKGDQPPPSPTADEEAALQEDFDVPF